MQQPTTVYVGMDVHKDSISVSYAASDLTGPPEFVGPIGTRKRDIDKMIRRLQSKASHLVFAYEAGPCGYVLYRHLTSKGFDCRVVAPSLIPKRAGAATRSSSRPGDVGGDLLLHRPFAPEPRPCLVPVG